MERKMFKLVLGADEVHASCNVAGHLAVMVGRGHGDGTLAVKEERNSIGVVWVAVVDFIEEHAEVGSGHSSGTAVLHSDSVEQVRSCFGQ